MPSPDSPRNSFAQTAAVIRFLSTSDTHVNGAVRLP